VCREERLLGSSFAGVAVVVGVFVVVVGELLLPH
jgi:hypothetical protein